MPFLDLPACVLWHTAKAVGPPIPTSRQERGNLVLRSLPIPTRWPNRLGGELDQERQARQKAEAEVASIHAAILEQIAISEAEEAITKAAEQEREQRLQEQIQGLHNQLELEIRNRTQIETKLKGIRQAFYDLMLPIEPEEISQQNGCSVRLLQLDVKH
jgi:hypothetical protein